MNTKSIELSVVVPVFNSAATLVELAMRLSDIMQEIADDQFELIFVNDGSSDSSRDILRALSEKNDKMIMIDLARNYGQHNATMCGFSQARGKYIVTMDDDLQIPPEEIPKLYSKILDGYDVVYGNYSIKKHSLLRNLGSAFIQAVYRKTFQSDVRFTSFRIIKNDIVKQMLSYQKSFTFIDGLLSWYTNNFGAVDVQHDCRKAGSSGYSVYKLILLAFNMMTNFSIILLQMASMTGFIFSLVGFFFGTYFFIIKIIWGIPVSGFASVIVAITIFSGVQLLTIGILGEYIGRIHINVSHKPQYAVQEILTQNKLYDSSADEKSDGRI